jgi:hypothetical protein
MLTRHNFDWEQQSTVCAQRQPFKIKGCRRKEFSWRSNRRRLRKLSTPHMLLILWEATHQVHQDKTKHVQYASDSAVKNVMQEVHKLEANLERP